MNLTEMAFSADTYAFISIYLYSETEYFGKVGTLMAGVAFSMFLFFPIIRGLPIKRRAFFSALPAGYCYWWGKHY